MTSTKIFLQNGNYERIEPEAGKGHILKVMSNLVSANWISYCVRFIIVSSTDVEYNSPYSEILKNIKLKTHYVVISDEVFQCLIFHCGTADYQMLNIEAILEQLSQREV